MAHFDIPQTLVQEDTNTGVIVTPLDGYYDCRTFSIFDPNGCKTPYDPSYCFMFLPEDNIYIQLNSVPAVIEFFEFDGTLQVIPFTLNGKTIIIDGADIPTFIDCFYIKIDGECTYGYQRLLCEDGTFTIKSEFTNKDFLGFDYDGTGYSNYLRFKGGFEFLGLRDEDKSSGTGRIVTRSQYERYLLRIASLPEPIARLALNILSGKNVQVNEELFFNRVTPLNEKRQDAKVWSLSVELERFISEQTFC